MQGEGGEGKGLNAGGEGGNVSFMHTLQCQKAWFCNEDWSEKFPNNRFNLHHILLPLANTERKYTPIRAHPILISAHHPPNIELCWLLRVVEVYPDGEGGGGASRQPSHAPCLPQAHPGLEPCVSHTDCTQGRVQGVLEGQLHPHQLGRGDVRAAQESVVNLKPLPFHTVQKFVSLLGYHRWFHNLREEGRGGE